MNEFVYFFKHKHVNAIKIGKTSGESVNDRFNQFKTYSPFGAEVLGFFKCENALKVEKEIHDIFKKQRLNGEWFDISIEAAMSIIDRYDSNKKVKSLFNEWLSDDKNDIDALRLLLSDACGKNERKKPDLNISIEHNMILDSFSTCEHNEGTKMTATEIKAHLDLKYSKDLSIKMIGCALNKIGFFKKHEKVNGKTKKSYHLVVKD